MTPTFLHHSLSSTAVRRGRRALAVAIASSLMLAASIVDAGAQSAPVAPAAPRLPPPPPAPDDVQPFEGVVRLYLLNEFGDVEGIVAQDGTQVRFPPHMGPDLVRVLKPGDRFVAQGNGTIGRGFRAYALGKPGATPLVEARPSAARPAPPPRGTRVAALAPMDVDGTIATILVNPRGEVDGVVLGDGTIVRLPPRSAIADGGALRIGARFAAQGVGTRNDYGRSLRAERVAIDGQAMTALQPRGPDGRAPVPPPTP